MLRADTYAKQPCAMAGHDCDDEPTVTLTRGMIMTTLRTKLLLRFGVRIYLRSPRLRGEYLRDRYPVTATL